VEFKTARFQALLGMELRGGFLISHMGVFFSIVAIEFG
jgi:hypothetical protein